MNDAYFDLKFSILEALADKLYILGMITPEERDKVNASSKKFIEEERERINKSLK